MRLFLCLVFFLFFTVAVVAEEPVDTTLIDPPDPGITPDNVLLWKIDTWSEKLFTTLTFDDEEKVKKSLASAEERLTEMVKMLRKNKMTAAEKAKLQHDDTIENARGYISYLDYSKKETELEKEYQVQEYLVNYNILVDSLYIDLLAENFDNEAYTFISDSFATIFQQQIVLAEELEIKKEDTKLKIKANGLTEDELANLEASIIAGMDTFTTVFDNAIVPLGVNEIIGAEIPDEIPEEETEEVYVGYTIGGGEQVAIITDTSSSTKINVDGEVSASQLDLIEALHDKLKEDNTKAEIEIVVTEVQSGAWKIEKEVDGLLTSVQDGMLDVLLLSLQQDPAAVRIKIKYDPRSDAAGIHVGSSVEGLETSFVIG